MEPSLDSWTTVFLLVAIHGIILSSIFFSRTKGRKLPNRLLGAFLFLFSVEILAYVAYWTKYNLEFPHILGLSASFHFLYGPILFLYVLSIFKSSGKLSKWHSLHFIPFLIYLIYLSPTYLMTTEQKLTFLQSVMQSGYELNASMRTVTAIKFIHMATYGLLIFNISKVKDYLHADFPVIQDEKRKWSSIIKFCFVGYLFAFAIFYATVDLIGYSLEFDYSITFAMSAFIFVIGYSGLTNPKYLYEAHNGAKYKNSTLEETEADQHLEKLLSYMKMEEPYLYGDLKLEDIAKELDIPRHHLSQIINQKLDKNFFEFINSYRIERAKEILTDPDNNYKILRVALEAGFNNKTTFNNAFKNEVGTTPSKFRAEFNNDEVLART